jgi:hypothetical protein
MVVSFMGSAFLSRSPFSYDRTEARIPSVERGSVLQVSSSSTQACASTAGRKDRRPPRGFVTWLD